MCIRDSPGRKYKEVFISLGGTQSAVYATEVSLDEYYTYTTEAVSYTHLLAELTEQQHRTALENGFGKQVIYGYENVLKTLERT